MIIDLSFEGLKLPSQDRIITKTLLFIVSWDFTFDTDQKTFDFQHRHLNSLGIAISLLALILLLLNKHSESILEYLERVLDSILDTSRMHNTL